MRNLLESPNSGAPHSRPSRHCMLAQPRRFSCSTSLERPEKPCSALSRAREGQKPELVEPPNVAEFIAEVAVEQTALFACQLPAVEPKPPVDAKRLSANPPCVATAGNLAADSKPWLPKSEVGGLSRLLAEPKRWEELLCKRRGRCASRKCERLADHCLDSVRKGAIWPTFPTEGNAAGDAPVVGMA